MPILEDTQGYNLGIMYRHFKRTILVILLLSLVACSTPGTTEVISTQPPNTPVVEETVILSTETPETVTLSPQPYTSQFDIFSINFPQGWNCSESGMFQTDCQSPQEDAAITVRVTGTGYELYQEDFESLVHA